MTYKPLLKVIKFYRHLSLQNIITLPFLIQIFVTVGLVGYFSWRNGEQAVNKVTSQLRREVTAGVETHLRNYLKTPHLIVRLKQNSFKSQLQIDDFASIQEDFWSTIQLFDSVRAIYMGYPSGKFVYTKQEAGQFYSKEVIEPPQRKTHALNPMGQKEKLLLVDEYIPQERPWYIQTEQIQSNNWSQIYTFTGGELGITAAGLIRDRQGNFRGIVGVDLVLSGIDLFLQGLETSDSGQVFILERNGYLVATSADEKPFVVDPVNKIERRLSGIDSQEILIKATTEYITERYGNLARFERPEQLEFELNGKNQLVQVVPYQDRLGLDWLIVVVMPEADFMAEIETNTRNTIWLCILALAIATVLGVYTSRKIAQPIANLSQVTQFIAHSAKAKNTSTNLYPVIYAKSIKELQSLAASFNEMVIQLKTAFRDLEYANETLEKRVTARTEALMTAKEAADAANHAKSEFIAKMSHELRTPLHAILGFTQIALQDSTLKPLQKENLLTVKRSGEHLLSLINDVLEVSKIEAGSLSLDVKTFDLHLLLDNLEKMFRLRALNKNIQLTFNLPPNLPRYIQTDPVKLYQILINLTENAIKFTVRGSVTLNLKFIEDSNTPQIAFAIIDTGHGILPSELESIFIPFAQTQNSDRQGTGLGLAICQQYVRLLGGEIGVKSELGRGSLFKFQIPITVAENIDDSDEVAIAVPLNTYSKPIEPTPTQIEPAVPVQMSTKWIEQLANAAIAVDSDLIWQLIEQIPADSSNLTAVLSKMLANFEYDEILKLAETELQKRSRTN